MRKALTPLCFLCLLFSLPGCGEEYGDVHFRQEMRDFVIGLSEYARDRNPGFIVIPQNGQELITPNGEADAAPVQAYVAAISGMGREDLFFGYNKDNEQTPAAERDYMLDLCRVFRENALTVLVTDYCSGHWKIDSSYVWNKREGFISFAADQRDLNRIPAYPERPFGENERDIRKLSEAENFLYLINSGDFSSKAGFISAVAATNYDVVIMDLFHNKEAFTKDELSQMKLKANGGSRLLICYMSIGEAEDYRYYWNPSWKRGDPDWLARENPDWRGNFKVEYWDPEWQQLIYGNSDSYLYRILEAGFDGVYLDIIDAFEYFE